jgi:hypothetical protein
MEAAGIEPTRQTTGNIGITVESGAESGALGAWKEQVDIGLVAVVEAWPRLPQAIKAGILAMIRASV